MSRILQNVEVDLDQELSEQLEWLAPGYGHFQILKKSVDARRGKPRFIYSVEVFEKSEDLKKEPIRLQKTTVALDHPVIIVGAGPAGLFAALRLLERGIPCRLLEQGEPTEKRVLSIAKFWRKGELNPRSNVGFGEGGAGLFSDGKLITRIKSPFIPYVMQRLVEFGAPEEIEYLSNPHVGSDKIRRVIPVMRKHLEKLGLEVRFNTKVKDLIYENKGVRGVVLDSGEKILSDHVILATGHSSDIFTALHQAEVFMEGKSFAVGLRLEHPQTAVNKMQYRDYFEHPKLGAANYKLAFTNKTSGVGVYSFCMCPGGYVLSSGTEPGQIVSNGMSNFNRGSAFANAAIVMSVDFQKNFGSDLFGGMKYRTQLEQQAYAQVLGSGGDAGIGSTAGARRELPAQRLLDFLEGRKSGEIPKTSSPSGAVSAPLHELFGAEFKAPFAKALEKFDRQMKGFVSSEAILFGVETRTSCPVRITRGESLESLSHKGLYPCGEGAGYAGGITSAACDGIRVAESIYSSL
jgi:uncharacterized FAD-dependent dehydrogenase